MSNLVDFHSYAVNPGAWHRPASDLPADPPATPPVRAIAYYLPQFHAEPVNDAAWGRNFTEWTNVTKALPRYVGHVQPRLPAELGFYDLTDVEVLRAQADLARRAGIHGFCIHDYWFSGTKVLSRPMEILLDNPDIDLNFCLNWANENWTRRWDGAEHEVILAQDYAPNDPAGYIDSVARALRDPRYIRVGGKPLLMIYRPSAVPDAAALVEGWRARAREIGIGELCVVMAQTFGDLDPRPFGIDAAAGFPPHMMKGGAWRRQPQRTKLRYFDSAFEGSIFEYAGLAAEIEPGERRDWRFYPGVCPSWDNEARRTARSHSFMGATPAGYGAWLEAAARMAAEAEDAEDRIVFVNAWNEWAEGAILEPCRHFGHAFLIETREAMARIAERPGPPPAALVLPEDTRTPDRFRPIPKGTSLLLRNRAVNGLRRRWLKYGRRFGLITSK